MASRARRYRESAGSAFAHGSGASTVDWSSSAANSALIAASGVMKTTGLLLRLYEGWPVGVPLIPNPAEEIIAAAVSSVLIVIEGSSTALLSARGNRGAQPRHYMVLLERLLYQLTILRRASGR